MSIVVLGFWVSGCSSFDWFIVSFAVSHKTLNPKPETVNPNLSWSGEPGPGTIVMLIQLSSPRAMQGVNV